MSVELERGRARMTYELRLARDFETLDRVYDTVEQCGFSVDHLEVTRAGAWLHCHIVLEGYASGLEWLDKSIHSVPGVDAAEARHPCSICRGQGRL